MTNIIDIYILMNRFDVIMSDMAPNASGIRQLDAENLYDLNCHVFNQIALKLLLEGGSVVFKFRQLPELKNFREQLKEHFSEVRIFKPAASREESSEIYVLAKHFCLTK